MHKTHCILSAMLTKYADIIPQNAIAPLQESVKLSGLYHDTQWSIHWNTAKSHEKRRINQDCNYIAFECYSKIIELHKALADWDTENQSKPDNWGKLIFDLLRAIESIELDHATEITKRQLSLKLDIPDLATQLAKNFL